MSFIQTLWASIAQSYATASLIAPANTMSDKMHGQEDVASQQQSAASQQLGHLSTQQHLYRLQQLQQSQPPQPSHHMSPWLQRPQCSYTQTSFYAAQHPWQYSGTYPHINSYNDAFYKYSTGHQFQYGFAQPTVSHSPPWPPSTYTAPYSTQDNRQVPSTYWTYGCPSQWAHGGDTHEYWHAQQQHQQQSSPSLFLSSPPPPLLPLNPHFRAQQAQPRCPWPYCPSGWSEHQHYSAYTQRATHSYYSYLSPAGVPFDLHQSSGQSQVGQSFNNNGSTSIGQHSGSQNASYGAPGRLAEKCKTSGHLPHETRTTANFPLPTCRPPYKGESKVDEKSQTALVRHEPEPCVPSARPYQGRQEDEYLQWDEHYGFGIAVPKPKGGSTRYSPAVNEDGPTSDVHAQLQRRSNIGLASSSQHGLEDGKQFDNHQDHYVSTGSSHAALFRTYDRLGRNLRQASAMQEDPDSRSNRPSSHSQQPTFHAVEAHRTPGSKLKIQNALSISENPVQLLEHSVDSNGNLQTTIHELSANTTVTTYPPINDYVLENGLRVQASHKQHMPISQLKRLAEGVSSSEGKRQAFDEARYPKNGNPASHTSPASNAIRDERSPQSAAQTPGELHSQELQNALEQQRALDKGNTSRVHCRSIMNSLLLSPPAKRVKVEPKSSPGSRGSKAAVKTETIVSTTQAADRWGNFAAHIAQEDRIMVLKACEQLNRLGGETFRPEFRERYKDVKGKEETTVHERSGGITIPVTTAVSASKPFVKEGEKRKEKADDKAVSADRAYDTDSSEGGVALTSSGIGMDSWVDIKTGDGNKT